MNFDILLLAFGLALVLEGLIPALFPNKWRAYVTKLAQEPVQSIRTIGIVLVVIGAIILMTSL